MWELTGNTDANRQQRRDEDPGRRRRRLQALGGGCWMTSRKHGQVVVLGSEAAIKAANDERGRGSSR